MIRVDINTLVADRTPIPQNLIGLEDETLRNLQTAIDPPPYPGFEWWDEVDGTPAFDDRVKKKGAETFNPDSGNRTVSVVCALTNLPLSEVVTLCEQAVMNKMNEVSAEEIDIGGGFMSTLKELQANRDLFDNGGVSFVNFKNGHRSFDAAETAAIKNTLRTRSQGLHNRAGTILDLIEAKTTGVDKVAVLDSEIDLGWPT